METLYSILGWPLGWIMWFLYLVVRNYGVALLLFTLVTRLALVPLSIKQQKSTVKTQVMQPQMAELQAKYKNNKEKLNEEMMKLYQKEGYNPMSGCLPLLIQMPILFGLIDVIYRPLKHILRLSPELIKKAEEIAAAATGMRQGGGLNYLQLAIIRGASETPQLYIDALGADFVAQVQSLRLNFLGMDLTLTPSFDLFKQMFTNFNPVIIIPILSGVSSLLVSLITMKVSANQAQGAAAGGNSMKGMMLIMPLFSTWIAFSVPAGVGLYWFYSNIAAMVQSLLLNKYYNPKEMAEKARLEHEEKQRLEREERIEAKKLARENSVELEKQQHAEGKGKGKSGKAKDIPETEEEIVIDEKALSQKELARRKLAAARKRDAEKYGEEYVEVTDEDLR